MPNWAAWYIALNLSYQKWRHLVLNEKFRKIIFANELQSKNSSLAASKNTPEYHCPKFDHKFPSTLRDLLIVLIKNIRTIEFFVRAINLFVSPLFEKTRKSNNFFTSTFIFMCFYFSFFSLTHQNLVNILFCEETYCSFA